MTQSQVVSEPPGLCGVLEWNILAESLIYFLEFIVYNNLSWENNSRDIRDDKNWIMIKKFISKNEKTKNEFCHTEGVMGDELYEHLMNMKS